MTKQFLREQREIELNPALVLPDPGDPARDSESLAVEQDALALRREALAGNERAILRKISKKHRH